MEKRQKIQWELALEGGGRGEAPKAPAQGIESTAAGLGRESQADTDKLMEEVCEKENLGQALRRVKANAGAAGVDGMSVQQLPDYLRENWSRCKEQLLTGTYRAQPVRRVEIPKAGGGVRKLGIPTVVDRFVQQAVMQVLQKRWDPSFSDSSYGFRPGRSAHQGVEKAQEYLRQGYDWVKDRKFLGFSFTGGESVKRRIAPQAVLRFKGRIRELTRRTRGISIERMIGELRRYMIGWRGYFGFCETPSILRELESWTRRRLRCFLCKQWKRGKARFKQLRKRGIGKELAARTAGSAHGPWRLSSSQALHYALPNAFFDSLGLPALVR